MSADFHVVDDSFEVFDVFQANKYPPRIDIFSEDDRRTLYVHRCIYDMEVQRGMETSIKAYNQLGKDIDRCDFLINGRRRTVNTIGTLPLALVRYCTQAVMALPIEAITSDNRLVAELKRPKTMRVHATDEGVLIEKTLRVISNGISYPVHIRIQMRINDPIVTVDYETGKGSCTEEGLGQLSV